jgi:triacylglycerol lipase
VPRRDLLTGARDAVRQAVWWGLDYAYVALWQVAGLVRPGGAQRFLHPDDPRDPPVVLVPGVYESWRFMRPLAAALHRHGHPVHVVQKLGFNRGTIPEMARLVAEHLAEADLTDVVVVAHSKGGLIGKFAMLHHDPQGRIRGVVAINTPFGGSPYARWIPLAAVRAFVPTDVTLAALTADLVVNSRITSVFNSFDPHIPGGSHLDGATNIRLRTPGHFRILSDPELVPTVLTALATARSAPQAPFQVPPG